MAENELAYVEGEIPGGLAENRHWGVMGKMEMLKVTQSGETEF